MIHYIYTLTDPRTKMVRYVGKTNKPNIRFSMHMCEKRGTHKNNWIAQLKALGLRPVMDIIEEVECSNNEWEARERFWISHFRDLGVPLTNLDSGGNSGRSLSEETKNKISKSHIGMKQTAQSIAKMKATKAAGLTQERREKYRAAQLGKKHTSETIAKMTASRMGHKTSAETKQKISDAQKGKYVPFSTRLKIRAARARQTNVKNQYTVNSLN